MEPKVSAVVTAMTDAEKPFIADTLNSMTDDPYLGQILVCVEQNNSWIAPIVDQSNDKRIQILYLPMMIVSAARNRGVEVADFEWIAFCDGDDMWCPGKTRIQLAVGCQEKASFIGTDHYLADENGRIRACALACYIPMPSSWLVEKSILIAHPFNENVRQGQDGEWWIRTHPTVKKVRCPIKLIKYRVRPNSLSSLRPSKKRKALVVQAASIPILDKVIFGITYLLWYFFRKDEYRWRDKSWGKNPALNTT